MCLALAGKQTGSSSVFLFLNLLPHRCRLHLSVRPFVPPLNCIFCIAAQVTHNRQTDADASGHKETAESADLCGGGAATTIMILAARPRPAATFPTERERSDQIAPRAWPRGGWRPTAYEGKSGRNGRSRRGTTIRSFRPSQYVFSNRPSNLLQQAPRRRWLAVK